MREPLLAYLRGAVSSGCVWLYSQHGDGVPENGGFSVSHVPDQLNRNANLTLAWQRTVWSLGYRHNVVRQDNRQPGRELADLPYAAGEVEAALRHRL